MEKQDKSKLINYIWMITDIIIIICSILLLLEGGTVNIVLAVIGILLVIFEVILYKRGYFKKI